jgi:hypothetical protein
LGRLDAGSGTFELAARGPVDAGERGSGFRGAGVATLLTDGGRTKFEQIERRADPDPRGRPLDLVGPARARGVPGAAIRIRIRRHLAGGDAGLLELRARASYLRIDTLLPLAWLLPQKDVRERLREVAPTGEWMDTSIELAPNRERSLAAAGSGGISRRGLRAGGPRAGLART